MKVRGKTHVGTIAQIGETAKGFEKNKLELIKKEFRLGVEIVAHRATTLDQT